jgi:hypothetical protein
MLNPDFVYGADDELIVRAAEDGQGDSGEPQSGWRGLLEDLFGWRGLPEE